METSIETEVGLSQKEVESRIREGKTNVQPESKTKTISQIIQENTLTLFNLLNVVLALMVFLVGSFQNLLFINVVVFNTIIGIIQEIKAKRTVDRLTLISQPLAVVLRAGEMIKIAFEEIVIDDIVVLKAGNQVPSDSKVISGELEVNEALLTGESDTIVKKADDLLLSGSFIVAGEAFVRVTAVGSENYASQLIDTVKRVKEPNSEIMRALRLIVKVAGVFIVPIGLILLYKQLVWMELPLDTAVVSVVAAVVGMIPQGLVLLTSVALAVSVIRLGRHQTLVQELYCIETLARVDMLCLDKTGTITEGSMEVLSLETLAADKNPVKAMRAIVANVKDDNPTAKALQDCCKGEVPKWKCDEVVHFSSERKWSGAHFVERGSYIIGAPEFVLKNRYHEIADKVNAYANEGQRVLVVCFSPQPFKEERVLPDELEAIGLIMLGDKIRKEAKKTLSFFKKQGVSIKVISGDNPLTVSKVAHRAGLANWQNYVDAATLDTDEKLSEAALKYTVFGRVSPVQKQLIIKTLKDNKHTVAMTGDGVNDILALREADCSIAMAEGSDAVRQVSQLVLLDSDFSNFKRVLMEGRRVINNISRAASLFLVKTLFSALLAIILIFANKAYPFVPVQLTLISSLTIGIPSVFLALEPNKNRVTGVFLETVLRKAFPGALAIVLNVLIVMIIGDWLGLSYLQKSTLTVICTGVTGLVILFRVSQPFSHKRLFLFVAMFVAFVGAIIFLNSFFYLVPIFEFNVRMNVLMLINLLLVYPITKISVYLIDRVEAFYLKWSAQKEKSAIKSRNIRE